MVILLNLIIMKLILNATSKFILNIINFKKIKYNLLKYLNFFLF